MRVCSCGCVTTLVCVCMFLNVTSAPCISGVHDMRGCEATSCLSVLSADRQREGQTCVSMAMSGCSPFPMCWERGMNEKSLYPHAHIHTDTSCKSVKPLYSVTSDSLGTILVYSQNYCCFAEVVCVSVCVCVRTKEAG